jgi:hypothetical protein
MKLHPLLLGRTKVPFGQFYGGLAGWEGFGALSLSHIEAPLNWRANVYLVQSRFVLTSPPAGLE